jgi:hypothetical protein
MAIQGYMNKNHHIVTYFIKEIFGIFFTWFGMIEINGLGTGQGPSPIHQWERHHETNGRISVSLLFSGVLGAFYAFTL